MSKILELYKEMAESNQRFIDEVFTDEIYRPAVPQLTIIDAGAYEGEFSFYCLNFAKKIYAFEPDPIPWQIFRGRIGSYDLHDQIELFNKALTGKSGERDFHNSGGGGSRIVDANDEYAPKNTIKVDSISLGDLMREKEIEQVDIFKIDIEGGEHEVFTSPEFPELSKKIKLIIGEHLADVDSLLKDLGYKATNVGHHNTQYERTNEE